MKSKSNRLPPSDPPDDWVDGSWTVDCICGVNFDDGEEMVNCDECGVWVHTRCFRFAKGEKSFACDKCKSKDNRNNNDSEETEVAQLLVELPTKTIKMSSSNKSSNHMNNNVYSFSNHIPPPPPPPPRRPAYRLWANRPMEEKVHVQGVPGGDDDPTLFKEFPIIFASELWKCTGYVPKKFNFRYREFPCWEKEEDVEAEANAKAEGDMENVVDRGAGVLYSLSKENVVSMRGSQAKGANSDRKGSKERKWENGDSKKVSTISSKNEKGVGRSIVLQCGKRSREDLGLSKDRSGKKKIKAVQKEQDRKKDKVHGSKAVIVHSSSARQGEVCESKAHKVASNAHLAEGSNIEKPKRNAATDEGNLVLRSPEAAGLGCLSEKRVKAEKPGHDTSDSAQKSAKAEAAPLLFAEKDSIARTPIKKEGIVVDVIDKIEGALPECQTSDLSKSKLLAEDVYNAAIEHNYTEVAKDVVTNVPLIFGNVDNPKDVTRSHPSEIDVGLDLDSMKDCTEGELSPNQEYVDSKLSKAVATISHPQGHEGQDNDKNLEAVSGSQLSKDEEITENQRNNTIKCESSDNSAEVQRTLSNSKEATRVAGETAKLGGESLHPPASYHKIVSVGKSSTSSAAIVISRSSLSDKSRSGISQNPSSIGKRVISNSDMGTKKESSPLNQVKDEDKFEKTKNMSKDHSKSSTNPFLKASQPTKSVTSPVLKQYTSLGKDSLRHPFSKKSSVESALPPAGINAPVGSLQTQHGSSGQNKNTASAGQRGEKALQPNLQSSSRSTQSSLGHPPPSSTAPAGLSDEELALLLHQELNSSPRVPRVPRVRHGGSLPQLSSATATSIFIKRSTTSGGKEQHTFSRRKNKDGSRSSREQDSEARKVDRVLSSPDSAKTSDALTQTEGQSESIHSVRKNNEDMSTSAANSGPSSAEANELKSPSTRDSPVHNAEDDTGTNKGLAPIHRTLPGLIAEIMGAGRRMTYEELCNAVLPHWQNLRKHNGERYAYSSHSQAVLDCLRNRSEWARLVDRGPKTNASRKKRKIDVEPPNTESEDGEDRILRDEKSKSFDSNKEEFPKGRRKAQNRRRLALRGRGVRDDRKRRKVETGTDDTASFSNSSEENSSSEDDSQGSGMCAAKSEVSASSADTVAVQS